ncbi:hypothetical protein DFH05DRAFT_961848 [Lentinula detonsa]|uniref:Uncharacterized protein n=1 Tax=Lentinula detonsa TaxID=2804962 RepID=A0A9W8P4E3_9AGAR|nr:hypothetical protein DFH05DRAFT_961848 [Lentinula detonsa]
MPIWLSWTLRDFATPEARAQLALQVRPREVMSNQQGFSYLIGHGYSKEQMERMFDIPDVPFSQESETRRRRNI